MLIAFYTFAIGHGPRGSDAIAGFMALLPAVLRHVDGAPGFIARAKRPDFTKAAFGQNFGAWGDYQVPRFYDGGIDAHTETQVTTLSLWSDIEAVCDFAYTGLHRRALEQGRKWLREPDYPSYVMWWVVDGEVPTWRDASMRLEYLHDRGPSPFAFDFKNAFESDGTPRTMSA